MSEKNRIVARGKPADYGQEIVKRRYRLTNKWIAPDGKHVLDFGCGNGAQTIEFAGCQCTIHAIDIDQSDLEVFKDYIVQNHITSITPQWYDGNTIPFPEEVFDIILSYEVLEHVENESETLKELYRVLKPGGEMIISVPNKGWVFETHGAKLPFLPWNRVPFFSWLPYSIHKRFAKARIYRKRDIVNLLELHSFQVVRSLYITAPMDVIKNPSVKKFLRATIFSSDSTTVSMFSTSILLHCKKNK